MSALYDLSRFLTSFNFFEWLVQAEADGETTVVFDARRIRSNKWPLAVAEERFRSICEPGPALAGMGYLVVRSEADVWKMEDSRNAWKPGGGGLVRHFRQGRTINRLRTVKPPADARYTVTLRKTQRSPLRNSDEAVWRDFAREIGARVIPDYEQERIHLHDRMALYAGSEMNFFCSNGPGILCSLSEYPCMMFNTHHARESLILDGMKDGEQYPWMLANQRAIWEEATPSSLRRHFWHWRETGTFL